MRQPAYRAWKKTWIPACPLGKQLLHFASQRSLLTRHIRQPLPIGQESFESYLPSKKIYLFKGTRWDFFWALLHNCTLSPSLNSKLLVTVVMMLQNLHSHMAWYLCTDFLVDCTPSPHDDMNSQDFSLVEMTKPLFATKIKRRNMW